MTVEKISIQQFLGLSGHYPVIDVRSPGEYNHAHIPGAYNLSLFTDEERRIVGTTYKQKSREEAIKVGLDFFGPKMKKMVEEVEGISNSEFGIRGNRDDQFLIPNSKILLIYCWRGGMRSAAVAWLMDLYGFKVYTLAGGYKKFRNHVLDTFSLPFRFKILGGYTGSGKTEVLHALRERGERVVDLESIARHKGSAFGNIGMPEQPTQEMFENLLGMELRGLAIGNDQWAMGKSPDTSFNIQNPASNTSPIWLEDESQRIGLVNIPNPLWENMRSSPVYFLDIPFEERLDHIVQEYGKLDKQQMIEAIGRIREKLGGLYAQTAIRLLEEDCTIESFRILLAYYDKFYFKALHNREALDSLLHTVESKSVTPENAQLLVHQPAYHSQRP